MDSKHSLKLESRLEVQQFKSCQLQYARQSQVKFKYQQSWKDVAFVADWPWISCGNHHREQSKAFKGKHHSRTNLQLVDRSFRTVD